MNSSEDPCFENVAALGKEYIGWTLVANQQAGPLRSLLLEADGTSRQINAHPEGQGLWAPDLAGAVFDPARFFPGGNPQIYAYVPGYSKRTLLGGFLPVADIGVWNPEYGAGYEAMTLLPDGVDAKPLGRIRITVPKEMAKAAFERETVLVDADGPPISIVTGTRRPKVSTVRSPVCGTTGGISSKTTWMSRSPTRGCSMPRAPGLPCPAAATADSNLHIKLGKARTPKYRNAAMRCFRSPITNLSGLSNSGI